jgi:hypothetical protein
MLLNNFVLHITEFILKCTTIPLSDILLQLISKERYLSVIWRLDYDHKLTYSVKMEELTRKISEEEKDMSVC